MSERQGDQLREQRVARELGNVATTSLKEEEDIERDEAQIDLLRPPEAARSLREDLEAIKLEGGLGCPKTKVAVGAVVADEAIFSVKPGWSARVD